GRVQRLEVGLDTGTARRIGAADREDHRPHGWACIGARAAIVASSGTRNGSTAPAIRIDSSMRAGGLYQRNGWSHDVGSRSESPPPEHSTRIASMPAVWR